MVVNVVDMNDNQPLFDKEEYRVTIRENIAPGTKIVQVKHVSILCDGVEQGEVDDDDVGRTFQSLSVTQAHKLLQYSCRGQRTKRTKVDDDNIAPKIDKNCQKINKPRFWKHTKY